MAKTGIVVLPDTDLSITNVPLPRIYKNDTTSQN